MRNLPLLLALLGCGASNPSNTTPPLDAGPDAPSVPPITQCPGMAVTEGSRFPFSVCDLGVEATRFVSIEVCATRNGVAIDTLRGFNSTHPERARCTPMVLNLQVDVR